MLKTRRVYTEEFKRDVVNLYLGSNKSYKELSEEVGVNASTLCQWKTDIEKNGDLSFPGKGLQKLTPANSRSEIRFYGITLFWVSYYENGSSFITFKEQLLFKEKAFIYYHRER